MESMYRDRTPVVTSLAPNGHQDPCQHLQQSENPASRSGLSSTIYLQNIQIGGEGGIRTPGTSCEPQHLGLNLVPVAPPAGIWIVRVVLQTRTLGSPVGNPSQQVAMEGLARRDATLGHEGVPLH